MNVNYINKKYIPKNFIVYLKSTLYPWMNIFEDMKNNMIIFREWDKYYEYYAYLYV